ncbi:MAG: glycosyltransferase family 4 protein [Candidatus Microgenomates bacterium]
MKIALVHDYLNEAGGAERVLRVLSEMYPDAPIYTAFIKNGTARDMFLDRKLYESSWGWILKIGRLYSYLRFLLPWVWRSIDLSSYDLVITSTSGGYIARGFRVGEKTRVVAYCHTPPKWLYGYETPTGAANKWWGRWFNYVFGPPLRYFDYRSAQRVNTWIANSREVAARIKKFYRREAQVVYPPVEIKSGVEKENNKRRDYFLLVTRVTGAKGVVEALNAARMGGFKLKLVGEVIEKRLKNIIKQAGENVEYLGRVSDLELGKLYAKARGFIALARDEDFGMTVVEAMQCGTPVLALRSGGYKETVLDKSKIQNTKIQTGVFVEETEPQSVVAGIRNMEKIKWDHKKISEWGQSFSRKRFEKEIRTLLRSIELRKGRG